MNTCAILYVRLSQLFLSATEKKKEKKHVLEGIFTVYFYVIRNVLI
jgi:hypothetical protein